MLVVSFVAFLMTCVYISALVHRAGFCFWPHRHQLCRVNSTVSALKLSMCVYTELTVLQRFSQLQDYVWKLWCVNSIVVTGVAMHVQSEP